MKNSFAISTITNLNVNDLSTFESTGIDNFDALTVLFEYLFTTEASLKDQNKYLFLFLQHYIEQHDVELINKLLSENALNDLHPSLLKSILIMTERIADEAALLKVTQILTAKI